MKQNRKFTVLIEQDEDGYYVATVPPLMAAILRLRTSTLSLKRVREVTLLCLEEQNGDPGSVLQTCKCLLTPSFHEL